MRLDLSWMLRLVDVAGAITQRGFATGIAARLELRVHDDVLAHNDAAFVVEIADGHAHVERGGSGAIELDVRGLAMLFSGFIDPWTLAATGGVKAEPARLSLLGACFGDGAPWMPEMV